MISAPSEEQQAADRADHIEGMHRFHGLDEGVFEEAEAVVGAPHQSLQDAGDPHRGDVEHDADGRDPEVPADQPQRIERLIPQPRHQAVDRAERHEADPAERAGVHVADGPVGVVRQRVHRLDRHDRPFEGRHAVEGDRQHHHAQHGIGAQLVPRARQRHQAVDHAAPGRHPQHDREGHAERLRPVRQRGVVQVMRAGPDVEEDQRPEVDDRQPIAVDRPLGALRDEVVHDPEEAGGEEEADGVVAVPPLHHGVLHARPHDVGLRREHRHRHGGVVAEMQDGDGENEGEIEPVGDIDVRLGAPHDGAEIDQQINDPHDGEPQIGIPFRFGIFLRLRDAEQIAGAGDDDEEVVAEDDEPRRDVAHHARPAGALHDIHRRRDQDVAAEREDDRRGVQRPQAAERDEGEVEIERRKGELERDPQADRESGDAPEHRRDGGELDRPHIVVRLAVDDRAARAPASDRNSGSRSQRSPPRCRRRTGRRGTHIPACRPWPRSRSKR